MTWAPSASRSWARTLVTPPITSLTSDTEHGLPTLLVLQVSNEGKDVSYAKTVIESFKQNNA